MPTEEYHWSEDWQRFNIPEGVDVLDVLVTGAGSNDSEGGRVAGKLRVDDKKNLWIKVGRTGAAPSGSNGGVKRGGDNAGGSGEGGDGGPGKSGGWSGGGASFIRVGAPDGPIRVVAGGAGGDSGDGGAGGAGGPATGQHGNPSPGSGTVGNATGGTQTQGGKGGNSSAGGSFNGKNGVNDRLGRAGAGAGPKSADTDGGGGGGGGFFGGGGGQAGKDGVAPSGGGAGGSNFVGGLYDVNANNSSGGAGDGLVRITWDAPGSNPPTSPNNLTIDGHPISDGLATKAKGSVTMKGSPNDPNGREDVRLLVRVSKTKNFVEWRRFRGTFDPEDEKDKVEITGLEQDARYWVRVHTQDSQQLISKTYSSTNFWMNRSPNPPTQITPAENQEIGELDNVVFTWNHTDPDPSDSQTAFRLRYRRAATPTRAAGAWSSIIEQVTAAETYTTANVFGGNVHYEWQVKTRDEQDKWGPWSLGKSYLVQADATPPILLEPIKDEAFVAAEEKRFRWKFMGPQNDVHQTRLDIRYRAVGGDEAWTTLFGEIDPGQPGTNQFWDIPADTFAASVHYEWQAKTYSSVGNESEWSNSAFFWTVEAPGSGAGIEVLDSGRPQDPLGEGNNRVFVYDRGGQVLRGEITPLVDVKWNRIRDDISKATIHITEWDESSKSFLRGLRTWTNELVVFREVNNKMTRVWEGPIIRISGNHEGLEIEAWDVMAYVYRRIMRQGYNDAYRVINGVQLGLKTVVHRAQQIVMNALAYDDPYILPYLTPLHFAGDATTSRVRPDYSRTAWEEVDDLAALAGLDYTASGRRLIMWDTHRPIGRLPEMRDGDFTKPPIITEYGMSAANYFAVTNGTGIWGAANRFSDQTDPELPLPGDEGFIEQLASAYGESEGAAVDQTLDKTAITKAQKAFEQQADRNISGRWPQPIVVRIPDNTPLSADVNLGINQLIPGVWVPLRSTGGVRELAQWQKLDEMTVSQTAADGEKVTVVFSPAPNEGQDPDADEVAEEGDQ